MMYWSYFKTRLRLESRNKEPTFEALRGQGHTTEDLNNLGKCWHLNLQEVKGIQTKKSQHPKLFEAKKKIPTNVYNNHAIVNNLNPTMVKRRPL